MVGALDGVTHGNYDVNIDQLSQWIQQTDRPVFLRIGYEFDNPGNGYDSQKYVEAYRYIVDRMRQNGVKNVAFVWHSYASSESADSLMKWYPGDDYVDWLGISYFRQSEHLMLPMVELAKQHQKPLMIAEATPMGLRTSDKSPSVMSYLWETWYQSLFDFAKRYNVKMISYINAPWDEQPMWRGQKLGDARIQANDFIRTKWLEEVNNRTYLQASPDLFEQLGYTQKE